MIFFLWKICHYALSKAAAVENTVSFPTFDHNNVQPSVVMTVLEMNSQHRCEKRPCCNGIPFIAGKQYYLGFVCSMCFRKYHILLLKRFALLMLTTRLVKFRCLVPKYIYEAAVKSCSTSKRSLPSAPLASKKKVHCSVCFLLQVLYQLWW